MLSCVRGGKPGITKSGYSTTELAVPPRETPGITKARYSTIKPALLPGDFKAIIWKLDLNNRVMQITC